MAIFMREFRAFNFMAFDCIAKIFKWMLTEIKKVNLFN